MKNSIKFLLITVVVLALAIIYFKFDPLSFSWFPKCIFHELTGLECPSCGGQRAVHAALHGNFLQALRFNPFIIVLVPYGVSLIYVSIIRTPKTAQFRRILLHRTIILTYCVLYIAWWIIRNII